MFNFKRYTLAITSLLIFILLLTPQIISACSCLLAPTVLDSFESAEFVVETKLISVNKVREKQKEYDIDYITSINMQVEKVYKGQVKVGDKLIFAQGDGADCIWTFDEDQIGEKFLFYLDKATRGHPFFSDEVKKKDIPMYHAVTCGRSSSLKDATDDILFLENIEKYIGRTRISGKVFNGYENNSSLENIEIKIIGKNKVYRVRTDKAGFYEIIDIPFGIYIIEPVLLNGWKLNKYLDREPSYLYNSHIVDKSAGKYLKNYKQSLQNENQIPIWVREKGHAELNLSLTVKNAIRGKVLSSSGEPMKGVQITAIPANSKNITGWGKYDITNSVGAYKIKSLPPDNYILVVNQDGKISPNQPFGTLFFPGVSNKNDADIIKMKVNKFVYDFDIQIPQIIDLIEVKGKLLYADGKPVAEENIKFIPIDKNKFDEIETESNEKGNFAIKIPRGAKGTLFGDMYVYKTEFRNCKKLEQILSEINKNYSDIKTNELRLTFDEDLLNVRFIFPLPKCEEAKE